MIHPVIDMMWWGQEVSPQPSKRHSSYTILFNKRNKTNLNINKDESNKEFIRTVLISLASELEE